MKLPADILVVSEKERFIYLLESYKVNPLAKEVEKDVFKMITLINRRMINAYNRARPK